MTWRQALLGAGWTALATAGAATILAPASALQVVLAAVATLALWLGGRDRSILPAALLVVIALPYDRAANIFQWRVADVPIRPQDVVIALGLMFSLPALRHVRMLPRWAWPSLAFLVIGGAALAYGVLSVENAIRDVLRDARWWFLWAAVILAATHAVRRDAVVRAILVGTATFCVVILAASLLPSFDGALKERALTYDYGLLRLQFGNTPFLLVGMAYSTARLLARPTPPVAALLLLYSVAAALSLTRTVLVIAVGVVILVILWMLWRHRGARRGWTNLVTRSAGVAAAVTLALALGMGIATSASGLPTPPVGEINQGGAPGQQPSGSPKVLPGGSPTPAQTAENPLERLLFQSEESDISSLFGGRFVTYERAAAIVLASPLAGGGLGSLVKAEYRFGGEEFGTEGKLGNVDNGLLTVGMKSGLPGMLIFAAMLVAPLVGRRGGRSQPWMVAAWIGLVALTMTQSFATTGYGPFVLGLLASAVAGGRGYARNSSPVAAAHE